MRPEDIQKLRALTSFEALIAYLRDELDWPIETEDAEELTFDYRPEELGIDPRHAVKIRYIKQLRPLAEGQPWGIFYLEFESKRLPVVVLRRILRALVPSARGCSPDRPVWQKEDLLFISSQGEPHRRSISFAHFRQRAGHAPELRTFSWDSRETHLYYIKNLNLAALRWPEDETDPEAWRAQWRKAFTVPHRYVPRTAKALAQEMARLAADIRDTVLDIYRVEHVSGPLHQLHLSFKITLINDLTPEDFADMYAQTVTYGLFSARATQQGEFAIEDVAALIPNTNPFLQELLRQVLNLEAVDGSTALTASLDELGVRQLADLLKQVDIEAILRDFGRQKRGEDPVIHFYETFMAAYDKEQKVKRGEFYTPDPVVSFIVRSVDYLLRTEFDCPDGLADTGTTAWQGQTVPKVQILDPATGTGTFLQYVIQVIWDTFYQKHRKMSAAVRNEKWNRYVAEHLLPRLYGFELKMAPYTIAHMKLGLKLKETGYEFASGERLRVYLTNALQPAHEVPRTDTPALAHEAEQAGRVKREVPITVVLGNPPYAVTSSNKGEWISNLVRRDYYPRDEIKEQNPKVLLDDYVKFIRLGQEIIARTGAGVLAMITNHGYLDNPTFRGMRWRLMQTFDEIYILDLHGNAKKKETAPDGSKDENVFDIQQGVAICLMVKRQETSEVSKTSEVSPARVYHADLYGTRAHKYEWLLTGHPDMRSVDWQPVHPHPPFYLFTPIEEKLREEYEQFLRIADDVFLVYSTGVKTHRDHFAYAHDCQILKTRIEQFRDISIDDERIANQYGLYDTRDWKIASRRRSLSATIEWEKYLLKGLFRPFDIRYLYYHRDVIELPRPEVMEHLAFDRNLSLLTNRQVNLPFQHVFCSRVVSDNCAVSSATRERTYVFPLYLSPEKLLHGSQRQMRLFDSSERNTHKIPNLHMSFLRLIEERLGLRFYIVKSDDKVGCTADDIFHYIYAILHSPTYRQRYEGFLRSDFPRLPLTSDVALFRALCQLGADLVALHLLEDDYPAASWNRAPLPLQGEGRGGGGSPLQNPITTFVAGANGTTMGAFSKRKCYHERRVYLDTSLGEASSYFDGVPEEVWNFHVGGYQVLHKWLYDRRGKKGQPGRTLTPEEIAHYQRVVVALRETMRLMEAIDDVIEDHGGWPI
jgi:hypothetical protein